MVHTQWEQGRAREAPWGRQSGNRVSATGQPARALPSWQLAVSVGPLLLTCPVELRAEGWEPVHNPGAG